MTDRIALLAPELVQSGTLYYEFEQLVISARPLVVKITLTGEGGLSRGIRLEGQEARDFIQANGPVPRQVLQWLITNNKTPGVIVTV